jgi:hypothetical protein
LPLLQTYYEIIQSLSHLHSCTVEVEIADRQGLANEILERLSQGIG